MKCNSSDVAAVSLECDDRGWVGRFDVVEFDSMVTCGGKKAFVGGYAEAIDLGVRVRDGTRTYTAQSFPEPVEMLVACR